MELNQNSFSSIMWESEIIDLFFFSKEIPVIDNWVPNDTPSVQLCNYV